MTHNPILQEICDARKQILEEYHGDTTACLRGAQERLQASGRPIAHRKQRTLQRAEAAQPDDLPVENLAASPEER